MSVICRLREYKADVEPDYGTALRPIGLGSAILVAAAALFLAHSFDGGATKAEAAGPGLAAGRTAQGGEISWEASRVASRNWSHLEAGARTAVVQVREGQDLTSPEWEGREALKDLKAMAVYEIRDQVRPGDEARKIAALLAEGGKL